MAILEEIKDSFRRGTALIRIIYINLAVFVLVNLIDVIFFLFNIQQGSFSLVRWLAVPADFSVLVTRPWTLITYMFLHKGFIHILFNLLWLYWFGRIFLEYLDEKKLTGVYVLGGLSGGLLYIIAFNLFPVFREILTRSFALGASAAVLAIVIAISVYVPNYTIFLLFLGRVKLKYIAIATIVIDLISIASSNAGGHIAHLGGALFGYLYIVQYRKGKDLTRGFNRLLGNLVSFFKPKPGIRVEYKRPETDMEYNRRKAEDRKEMDRILEKIARSGYDSLSKKEKDFLFSHSNKS